MREIKFRAWDTNKVDKENMKMAYFPISPYDNKHVDLNEQLRCLQVNGVKLMQYTGLKDKNGKEIYERDIVKTHHITYDNNPIPRIDQEWDEIGEVSFLPTSGFFIQNKKHGNNHRFFPQTEIIGNIYENPDLLQTKDKPNE